MAEAIGVVASGIAIGTLATGITRSIVKLKSYWDQVQDAPEDVQELIEELDVLSLLLADMEDDQRQNPMSSLILDSTSTYRCLQHCKQGADRLKELTENLSTDLDASSKLKRKRASAKVVLKKSQIDRYRTKLERAIRLLSLSHQSYTRALLRLQPDIIVTRLSQSTTSGSPLLSEALDSDHSSILRLDDAANGTITNPTAINLRSNQSWNIGNLFGTFLYRRGRNSIVKRNGLDYHDNKREVEEIIAEYRGPSWLVNRVWRIQAVKASYGLTFCLRTYNVISLDSPVFDCAVLNNVRGLQELFSEMKASPFDCDDWDMTPLHYAAGFHNHDVCEFLIREGADPNHLAGGISTSLEWAMFCALNSGEVADVPRLLLNETERETNMGWYRGPKEGFSIWQQSADPFYYERPLQERFDVATSLSYKGHGPDVLRLSLAPGPLPPLAYSITNDHGMTLLNVVARSMGRKMLWSQNSLMHLVQHEMDPTEWKFLVKELIAQGANFHFISSLSNTPFVDLLGGLFEEIHMKPSVFDPDDLGFAELSVSNDPESTESSVSDLDDLGSMQHSVCNSLGARCSRLEKLPWLLDIWLECLQESGVDLEAYGRKETDIHRQGIVAWTWAPDEAEAVSESESGVWCMTSLTYGPSPSDWQIDVEYQPEDAAESLAKMPGGWMEDEQCEGGEDLCVEEGREIEEQDS